MRNSISKAVLAAYAVIIAMASGCNTTPISRNLGARCQSHGDCTEMCLPAPVYPDGFCTTLCDDDSDCPGSGVCVAENHGICLVPCTEPADCTYLGQGWTCAELAHRRDGVVTACVGQ